MSNTTKYSAANITQQSIDKISSLEKELSNECHEDVILVAYSPNEPSK